MLSAAGGLWSEHFGSTAGGQRAGSRRLAVSKFVQFLVDWDRGLAETRRLLGHSCRRTLAQPRSARSKGVMGSEDGALTVLRDLLEARLPDLARAWFSAAPAHFVAAFSAAGRRLGAEPLRPTPREVERVREISPELHLEAWGMDDLGRVTLLLEAVHRMVPSAAEELVNECFFRGDSRERQAVLRALPLLPEPQRFISIAKEACRSSVQPVFEAIACENPFPARYFPQHSFNQMVLKAVFTGAAIRRIVGLERRSSDELARMASDYARERRAAGRHVPPDLQQLMSRSGGAHENI